MKNCIDLRKGCVVAQVLISFWMFWVLGMTQAWGQTWNMCGPLIRQYEAAHGIPPKLLTAISLVESGRKVGGSVVAWPWTLNANGKAYIFATKKEAIAMVRKLHRIGITSIDVGCMQVNLKQHPDAFSTLEAAFDPATNIAYAAKFLKAKKINTGTWRGAVAHYHSSKRKFHGRYIAKVFKKLAKVQNDYMTVHAPFEEEYPAVEMTYPDAEIEKYTGEHVENVAAPSGRRLPMIVRFAPYKGFHGGISGASQLLSRENRGDGGPKIIRGRPKGSGKIIINRFGRLPDQKPLQTQGTDLPGKVIYISVKADAVMLPPQP